MQFGSKIKHKGVLTWVVSCGQWITHLYCKSGACPIFSWLGVPTYICVYSTKCHSGARECLQIIQETDFVVFVLILFPQMSNILLLKSVSMTPPSMSNKIMCPYYRYVVQMCESVFTFQNVLMSEV